MFTFNYIQNGHKATETINAATFADAKAQVINCHDLSTMDEATLTDERYNIPSRWVIQDRETGTEIDYFDSYEEACAELNRYEQDDMDNGVYTPDFYEIREK